MSTAYPLAHSFAGVSRHNSSLPTYWEIEAENPCRNPAWRFDRATAIVREQGGRWHPIRDDELTQKCARYLSAKSNAGGKQQSQSAERAEYNSPVCCCVELYTHPRYRSLRFEVEARIISGQTNHEIAAATGLPQEVITAYESICFQIRDRLGASGYILNHVINITPLKELYGLEVREQLLFMAYAGGPCVLDLTLFCMRATGKSQLKLQELISQAVTAIAHEARYELTVLSQEMPKLIINLCNMFRGPGTASCTSGAEHERREAA